jgi:NAD(P)-dependent dehydrogenase (short-subunit alcohol dehydrogenase family)
VGKTGSGGGVARAAVDLVSAAGYFVIVLLRAVLPEVQQIAADLILSSNRDGLRVL